MERVRKKRKIDELNFTSDVECQIEVGTHDTVCHTEETHQEPLGEADLDTGTEVDVELEDSEPEAWDDNFDSDKTEGW